MMGCGKSVTVQLKIAVDAILLNTAPSNNEDAHLTELYFVCDARAEYHGAAWNTF